MAFNGKNERWWRELTLKGKSEAVGVRILTKY